MCASCAEEEDKCTLCHEEVKKALYFTVPLHSQCMDKGPMQRWIEHLHWGFSTRTTPGGLHQAGQ